MSKLRSKFAAVLAATTVLSLSTSGAASAEPSYPRGDYCAVLVGKAPSKNENSPVLAEHCSNVSQDHARKNLMIAAGEIGISSDTKLMTWYEHRSYNRYNDGATTTIYGSDGHCDTAGYRVEPNWWWNDEISSISGTWYCNKARITNQERTDARTFDLPANYIYEYNDDVGVIWVFRG